MIDVDRARRTLENRYDTLTEVSRHVFRATDVYESHTYAVRYFDLQDTLEVTARELTGYQDTLLGKDFFSRDATPDLRWNYYLYFITSQKDWAEPTFRSARAAIEADHQYARKRVVAEGELESLLAVRHFADDVRPLPPDPLKVWTDVLGDHDLTFIVDDALQVPAVVRKIESGESAGLGVPPSTPQLTAAERGATSYFLASLEVAEFRPHPAQRTFSFSDVNLITGANGSGKTSLLEAIEFLFCGQTRRSGKVPARTVVTGRFDSSLTLSARPTVQGNRLRARHLAWYGKADLRKVTLHDSFGKFNFLDTDAAVRLSVEISRERISQDLAQLLLGAEAVKTLDRFHRVLRAISSARTTIEREAAVQDLRSREARRRAEELRQASRDSDELFRKLEVSLGGFGWINIPSGKDSIDGLGEALEMAVINSRLLRESGKGLPREQVELEKLLEETREAIERTRSLVEEQRAALREQSREEKRNEELAARENALDALAAVVASGLEEHTSRLSALRASVGSLTGMVAEVESAVAVLTEGDFGGGSLDEALATCAQRIGAAREAGAQAKEAVREFESRQDTLRSLRQRLVHCAREVISHGADAAHCPLCGTRFEEGRLLERIGASLKDGGEGDGAALRNAAEIADRDVDAATRELKALEVLRRAMAAETDVGLTAAVEKAGLLRLKLQAEAAELGSLEGKVKGLAAQGITVSRAVELRRRTGLANTDASASTVQDALEAVREERQQGVGAAEKIVARLASVDSRLKQEAEAWAGTAIAEGEAVASLEERADTILEVVTAVGKLANLLRLPTSTSDAVLEGSLTRASELVTELRSALSLEESNLAMLGREVDTEKDAVDSLRGLRVRLKRLDAAESLVENLLAEHSEEALREEVLRNNATEISSTFARLHAPNEFDLRVEEGQLHIARRSNGAAVELHEMSSGQRAAYALSLFLAMNESLRNGPKVLLLDDPVAHIDDINTLSFLDYLRDVALGGARQLFFATADVQLAGLFKHKFRFLGEERFRVFDLARAEETGS